VDWAILRGWTPWIMLGAVLGMALAGLMSKGMLLGAFGALLVLLALQLFFGRPEWRLAPALPGGLPRAGLGTGVGALSAIMGIGGGTFGVTLMTLCGVPIHRAVATAAGWGIAIGLPAALAAILIGLGREGLPPGSLGLVNLPAFALISVFTVLMAPVGAKVAHRLNAARLRRLFAILLTLVAGRMLWQAAGLLRKTAHAFARAALTAPEARGQDDENRHEFQPPEQHGEGAHPFGKIRQAREVSRWPDRGTKGGAHIRNHRSRCGDG
jgi:uncharacterized membrane protein YfcA